MARVTLITIFSTLALAASVAHAASGTIRFYGAVVEPTCEVAATTAARLPVAASEQTLQTCGRTATNPGRTYAQSVEQVDAATASDRLLGYYASYAAPSGSAAPSVRVVTRTYL